ncbi:MAG: A24 family peptidase [Actinomycetota bacterium]|nr:A24 family peptidase [Actinomycetota bacterium]
MVGDLAWALAGGGAGWVAARAALLVTPGVELGTRLPARREQGLGLAMGMVAGYLASRGAGVELYGLLCSLALIPHALIDLRHRLVYPALVLASIALALVGRALSGDLASGLFGLLIGCGVLLLFYGLGRAAYGAEVLGGGDVMLASMIGAMAGAERVLPVLIGGAILGAVWALLLLVTRRASRSSHIPYGAALCIAAILSLAGG